MTQLSPEDLFRLEDIHTSLPITEKVGRWVRDNAMDLWQQNLLTRQDQAPYALILTPLARAAIGAR